MKIGQKELAAMEAQGAKVTRSRAPKKPAPVKRDKPVVQDARAMAAMSASLDAYRAEGRAYQEATHTLLAQNAETVKMLGEQLAERSAARSIDFEIERDETVKGDYKPIKRIRARAI